MSKTARIFIADVIAISSLVIGFFFGVDFLRNISVAWFLVLACFGFLIGFCALCSNDEKWLLNLGRMRMRHGKFRKGWSIFSTVVSCSVLAGCGHFAVFGFYAAGCLIFRAGLDRAVGMAKEPQHAE